MGKREELGGNEGSGERGEKVRGGGERRGEDICGDIDTV